ncbi:MAG: hypothetical protein KDJ19_09050 [Hyphomicrobiaceae bacterium]|nr:hypothetical protein [Hyphomicrobiaceae bacterium]MCC0023305.1 hypothetical protein [Hyphomicrobiaceae bacterium]
MTQQSFLKTSWAAALVSLVLIILATVVALGTEPHAGQEGFEVFADTATYVANMAAAGDRLRIVLYIDGLFMMSYTVAIGAALLAFAQNNRAAAILSGIGIVAVFLLDAFENAVMAQSINMVAAGDALEQSRIGFQAMVSAMKWQTASLILFSTSFVLPSKTFVEKLLVWGARLGLPLSVPLFVSNAFGLRTFAGPLMLLSMGGGFILLALVTRKRLQMSRTES